MIVRCIFGSHSSYIRKRWKKNSDYPDGYAFQVTPGKLYVVYGISLDGDTGCVEYLISDDDNEYPLLVPALEFEIVDAQVSKHWKIAVTRYEQGVGSDLQISFEEWFTPQFFDDLTDLHEPMRSQWKARKLLMDEEAAEAMEKARAK